jgi:hypothetical protein
MKELQSEITLNGIKYYAAHAVAERQTDWYNLGIANGMEAAKKELNVNSCNHGECIAGLKEAYEKSYDDGYDDGYENGFDDGKDDDKTDGSPVDDKTFHQRKSGAYPNVKQTRYEWYCNALNDDMTELNVNCCNHDECTCCKGRRNVSDVQNESFAQGYDAGKKDGHIRLKKLLRDMYESL